MRRQCDLRYLIKSKNELRKTLLEKLKPMFVEKNQQKAVLAGRETFNALRIEAAFSLVIAHEYFVIGLSCFKNTSRMKRIQIMITYHLFVVTSLKEISKMLQKL